MVQFDVHTLTAVPTEALGDISRLHCTLVGGL